jgi:iron complex transport system permease protein
VLLPRRAALVGLGLCALAALAVLAALLVGSAGISPAQAVGALLGHGSGGQRLLVQRIRLPRVLAGLLAGAALGAAGALTQTLARNKLATPDLLGVHDGATVAMLAGVAGSSTGMLGAWWIGPLGAIGAGVLVVLVAGGLATSGYRVLVCGLALSTMIGALTNLLMARQNLNTAGGLFLWTMGDLNGRGYAVAAPVALALAVLLPGALLAGRRLTLLRLDPELARTLGLSDSATRLLVLALAVALAGLAVGVAGPISFVAMAAPVIAGRLTGPVRVPLVCSALTGAVLVVFADALGRVIAPTEIPVGVVTSVLGGPFLLWVLLSDPSSRRC